MKRLICYNCFAEFPLHSLQFKCFHHGPKPHYYPLIPEIKGFQPLRQSARFLRRRTIRKPPAACVCGRSRDKYGNKLDDGCPRLSSHRACPVCKKDLPHYLGLAPQRIVAVTGWSGSGKSVYQWSLLHQLRLGSAPQPFITCMFEDDASFSEYEKMHETIIVRHRVPKHTQAETQKEHGIAPVITRLFGPGLRGMANLIFYDPSGELMQDLNDARYLQYLAHASAIIYLVDPRDGDESSAFGLEAVIKQISGQLRISPERRIQKPLAVVLTKSDLPAFDELRRQGRDRVLLDSPPDPAAFWLRRRRYEPTIAASSRLVEEFLRSQCRLENLVNIASQRFALVRYFAVSALGQQPAEARLTPPVTPHGPENPLFWALRELGL